MRIAIIAKSGPAAGRRLVLRGGQIARIGRTDWADFALPEDVELADIHFAIHGGIQTAVIQSLASDRETRLNGTPVEKQEIQHGDVIEAGSTLFFIGIICPPVGYKGRPRELETWLGSAGNGLGVE